MKKETGTTETWTSKKPSKKPSTLFDDNRDHKDQNQKEWD